MRAERFRGWRTRSPNWRNELNEKDIRQKSPAVPGFFFYCRVADSCELPHARIFTCCNFVAPETGMRGNAASAPSILMTAMLRHTFEIATART
jgi:hypothetical protein